jgi:ribosomal protein S16
MLKLRLKRYGKKQEVSYRIVAMNSSTRRDGRAIEELGFYNPRTDETRLNVPAILRRLQQGAQPTETVRNILEKANIIEPRQDSSCKKPNKPSPLIKNPPPITAVEREISQVNAGVDANPQLRQLREESNPDAWNQLVKWICERIGEVDLEQAERDVKILQLKHPNEQPSQIAKRIIVEKSFQAVRVELIRGFVPNVEILLNELAGVNLPEITKLSAEMVYQIAAGYGLNLQTPERKLEVLAAFCAALLGEQAIHVGLSWLKTGYITEVFASASIKALMIYAVGHAACWFYEAKVKEKINPLKSEEKFAVLRQESQDYLEDAIISEEAIIAKISDEIKTVEPSSGEISAHPEENNEIYSEKNHNKQNESSFQETLKAKEEDLSQRLVALGDSGQVAYIPLLISYIYYPDSHIRGLVASALGKIAAFQGVRVEVQRAIPILGKLSQDPESLVRQSAVTALGKIKSENVIPFLKVALRDSDSEVVKSASAAFDKLMFYRMSQELKPFKASSRRPNR